MPSNNFYEIDSDDGFLRKWTLHFLDSIDLSNNLGRATKAIATITNGVTSLILSVIALVCMVGFGALAWIYDIDSSWDATMIIQSDMAKAVPDMAIPILGGMSLLALLPFILGLLPTAIEALGSKFAQFNISAFQYIVWVAVIFDFATDLPRVNSTLQGQWPLFVGANNVEGNALSFLVSLDFKALGGAIGYGIVWCGWALGATYFFELLFVLSAWTFIALLVKSFGYWVISALLDQEWFSAWWENLQGDDGPPKGKSQTAPRPAQPAAARPQAGVDPRRVV